MSAKPLVGSRQNFAELMEHPLHYFWQNLGSDQVRALSYDVLTLAGTRHFPILDGTRGEGATPRRVSKLSVVELSGKTGGLPSMSTRDRCFVFDLRSKFGPIMRWQRSNFREIGKFSALQVHI